MPKTILKLLLGSVLLIAQACAPLGTGTLDPNSINTAIAQTAAVLPQTIEPGIPVTGDELPTPTQTALPTVTQTPSSTPLPLFTSTAVTPLISVSVPTNCREGPGVVYDRVGGLQLGEVAEIVGRYATRDYWIIVNPNRPDDICWLWGEYAIVTGNTDTLPIYTPPPTPTPLPTFTPNPTFDVAYNNFESCTGTGWWVDFELENHGSITFNSMSMTVRDTVNNAVLSLYVNDFTDRDGCNDSEMRDSLPAGEELLASSPVFTSDPRGHALLVTITLCSDTNQSGACATKSISFTP